MRHHVWFQCEDVGPAGPEPQNLLTIRFHTFSRIISLQDVSHLFRDKAAQGGALCFIAPPVVRRPPEVPGQQLPTAASLRCNRNNPIKWWIAFHTDYCASVTPAGGGGLKAAAPPPPTLTVSALLLKTNY